VFCAGRRVLHRAELTALERGRLVKEWAELVGENKPAQVQHVSGGQGAQVDHPDSRYQKRGTSKAARQLNLSRVKDVTSTDTLVVACPGGQPLLPWPDPKNC
jgi:hypothetical protein